MKFYEHFQTDGVNTVHITINNAFRLQNVQPFDSARAQSSATMHALTPTRPSIRQLYEKLVQSMPFPFRPLPGNAVISRRIVHNHSLVQILIKM